MPFDFQPGRLPGSFRVIPKIFRDNRGWFLELHADQAFDQGPLKSLRFVQDNLSSSSLGVVRGLHYQLAPYAQGKLVCCIRGKIMDCIVDLRQGSLFYGQWEGYELDDVEHQMIYVPPGFAHGFQALTEDALVLYKCTAGYQPGQERAIRWNDPSIGISWPVQPVVVSDKDKSAPLFADAEHNFVWENHEDRSIS